MPYVSDKQRAFLKINKPEVAAKFDAHSGGKKGKKKRKKMKTKADLEGYLGGII